MKIEAGKHIVGRAGSAKQVLVRMEPSERPTATIALWFLDCPGQSPAWRHYELAIIHLRPLEGHKPAYIMVDGATHEVILAALDPRANPCPTDLKTWRMLRPINFTGQLYLPSDEDAKTCLEALAQGVVDGFLWAEPFLSGAREPWSSQLLQLEAHATGKHFQ